jgi:hypothetical protein
LRDGFTLRRIGYFSSADEFVEGVRRRFFPSRSAYQGEGYYGSALVSLKVRPNEEKMMAIRNDSVAAGGTLLSCARKIGEFSP